MNCDKDMCKQIVDLFYNEKIGSCDICKLKKYDNDIQECYKYCIERHFRQLIYQIF